MTVDLARLGLCRDEDCGGMLRVLLPVAAVLDGIVVVDEAEPGEFAMTVECDTCGDEIDTDAEAWDLRFASGSVA